MKNNQLLIPFLGATSPANPESAVTGEAADCLNLRERENALQAVGTPVSIATIGQGERLLCVDDGRYITLSGNRVLCDGTEVVTAQGEVRAAFVSGRFLVIDTSQGYLYLHRSSSGYDLLEPEQAIPTLHLTATEVTPFTENIDAYDFDTPYVHWQAPLSQTDVAALTRIADSAHTRLSRRAADAGLFSAPVLCRYAVRAFDDRYLWVSAPVLMGGDTLAADYRTTVEVSSTSSGFTGFGACQASRSCYRLGVTVAGGVDDSWLGLVKAIDVFVTDPSPLIEPDSLDYRCSISTVGTRRYFLEFGPKPRSRGAIAHALLHARWRLAATTTHVAELATGAFITLEHTASATSAIPGRTTWVLPLSLSQQYVDNVFFDAIQRNIRYHVAPATTLAHNDRIYTGGCALLPIDVWNPVTLFEGNISSQPCHVATAITLLTPDGICTLVRHHDLPFTPQSLNPVLSTPHLQAISMRVEVTASGTTRAWEADLAPVTHMGIAAAVSQQLTAHPLSLATATIPPAGTATPVEHCGLILAHAISNPLVLENTHDITGCHITALAAASKPIYSGGLGRYPLYAFTRSGIFALPQSAAGSYGEARLILNMAISEAVTPVQGERCVWFISDKGALCDLSGSTVTRHLKHCVATHLAWNSAEQELWMRHPDSSLQLLMRHGRTTRLSLQAAQLWSRDTNALAIDAQGNVLDITHEAPCQQCTILYRSHPVLLHPLMRRDVHSLVWNVFASQAHLHLRLLGERGTSCHGFPVTSIHVQGPLNTPLHIPVVAPAMRNIRLVIEGQVESGTLLLPATIFTSKP
jgi:hypothetical protein